MVYECVHGFVHSYARACFLNRGIPGNTERTQPTHPGEPKPPAETSHLLQDLFPRGNEEKGADLHGTVLCNANECCNNPIYFHSWRCCPRDGIIQSKDSGSWPVLEHEEEPATKVTPGAVVYKPTTTTKKKGRKSKKAKHIFSLIWLIWFSVLDQGKLGVCGANFCSCRWEWKQREPEMPRFQ